MTGCTPANSHHTAGIPSPSVTSTKRASLSNDRNETVQSDQSFARESAGLKSFPVTTSGHSAIARTPSPLKLVTWKTSIPSAVASTRCGIAHSPVPYCLSSRF